MLRVPRVKRYVLIPIELFLVTPSGEFVRCVEVHVFEDVEDEEDDICFRHTRCYLNVSFIPLAYESRKCKRSFLSPCQSPRASSMHLLKNRNSILYSYMFFTKHKNKHVYTTTKLLPIAVPRICCQHLPLNIK